jgi:hypothetical protein
LHEYIFVTGFFHLYKDGKVDPHLVFYPHGALFSLCGNVNYKKSHKWSAKNKGLVQKLKIKKEKKNYCSVSGQELQVVNNTFRLYADCLQ